MNESIICSCEQGMLISLQWLVEEQKNLKSSALYVWEYFGFPVKYNVDGSSMVDKAVMVCRHWLWHEKAVWKHPWSATDRIQNTTTTQLLLTTAFKQSFAAESEWAKKITKSIRILFTEDMMRPYSILESKGEKYVESAWATVKKSSHTPTSGWRLCQNFTNRKKSKLITPQFKEN